MKRDGAGVDGLPPTPSSQEGVNARVAPSCEEGDGGVYDGRMSELFNRNSHIELRRQLREGMTEPEKLVWLRLRGDQLGHRFRRQFGVGRYILDFYCPTLRIAVEIDGDSHAGPEAEAYDRIRDDYLKSLNIVTLRFANRDVMENSDGILERIRETCEGRVDVLPPAPSSQEGGMPE